MNKRMILRIIAATLSAGWFIYYIVSDLTGQLNKYALLISLGCVVIVIAVLLIINHFLINKEQ